MPYRITGPPYTVPTYLPVVLDDVGFGKLCALPVAEAPHGLGGGDDVRHAQVNLQPLAGVPPDHVARAPGAPVLVHPDPEARA